MYVRQLSVHHRLRHLCIRCEILWPIRLYDLSVPTRDLLPAALETLSLRNLTLDAASHTAIFRLPQLTGLVLGGCFGPIDLWLDDPRRFRGGAGLLELRVEQHLTSAQLRLIAQRCPLLHFTFERITENASSSALDQFTHLQELRLTADLLSNVQMKALADLPCFRSLVLVKPFCVLRLCLAHLKVMAGSRDVDALRMAHWARGR